MKMLAPALALALTTLVGSISPDPVVAQSVNDPFGPAISGPFVGEELMVTYVTNRYGPVALSATRTVRLELVSYEADRLIGRYRGQLMVIDARSIRRVRRRIGTKPASAPAMAFGSAGGFLAGFLIGAIAHQEGGYARSSRSKTDDGLVAGVLIGAPLGAFVAWVASRSRPIYEDVGLPAARPGVAVSPTGQVDLSFSIPIR